MRDAIAPFVMVSVVALVIALCEWHNEHARAEAYWLRKNFCEASCDALHMRPGQRFADVGAYCTCISDRRVVRVDSSGNVRTAWTFGKVAR